MKTILVTGCAGFIGSNYVRYVLENDADAAMIGLDVLNYRGRRDNLTSADASDRFEFVHGSVCDEELVRELMAKVDHVVNFAAESFVDRSVLDHRPFLQSNVAGVDVLLRAARDSGVTRFLQISTPEVYGPRLTDAADELDALRPRNPYAGCKAAAEMLARAYQHSFGVPVLFTRGANAVGPQQHIENAVPLFVTNALDGEQLPLYGSGVAVRDWTFVDDLNSANHLVLCEGEVGAAYNIAGGNERSLVQLGETVLRELGLEGQDLLQFIGERPAHDHRYHLDTTRLRALGWRPRNSFEDTIFETVRWYRENESWWRPVKESEQLRESRRAIYDPKKVGAKAS
ncbi:dTDP-glucose 4,6-dehydratase [Amycolatopsis panacis]|uniref:NAD-dependent epimerase/dehydratase family protein n=1 Tax=Amycolatopsis panacis TaxID=2340917 RepID=A0A419HXD0_9PSEU|nr:GDP-mannose 4,6-dehydratase [Amycolatopsis panacis]RJQ81692.1 NAD-dependent epimerase/dehydratase family protein [Amycolatopsis panacis]